MAGTWRSLTLGEVLRIKHGYAFKGEYFADDGPYVLLTPGNFEPSGGLKLKGEKEKYYIGDFPAAFLLQHGDLLVAMTDLTQSARILGSPGVVPESGRFLHNQRLGKVVDLKEDLIDRRFLYHLLNHHDVREQIKASATGATVRHTAPERIYAVKVELPDVREQRRIASILSAYDDLIENNMRRIAILEEMARRICEEWFVRFRFPGHEGLRMLESELGPVPEGWSVQGLYDVAELTYGFPFKSKLFDSSGDGIGVIRIRDIKGDSTNTFTTESADSKYRVENGDILIGMDGEFHMGRWAGGDAWLNQRVVRLRPHDGVPRSWLFWVTEGPIKRLEAIIVGTTVAHLSARDLKEMKLVVPDVGMLKKAASVLEPIYDLELSLKQQNANLRTTRDLLLPKLISGELDVSELPLREAVAA